MESKPKVVLSNRLYVPTEFVSPDHRKAWTFKLPVTYAAEELQDDDLVALLYREFPTGYTGFHRGDLGAIYKTFAPDFRFDDQRTRAPLPYPLMLTKPLYPVQRSTIERWLQFGYGHLLAPPRSGKTVMITGLICICGQRTLILAAQWEWLQQFENTLRTFTNITELEKVHGRTLLKLVDTREEMLKYDIVLSTYQKFLSPQGKKFLGKIRDRFGFVGVDEADQSSATHYSRVVGRFNSLYRVGCTATHKRKDGKECIAFNVLGPVTAESKTDQMRCAVYVMSTGYKAPYWHRTRWYLFYRRLTENIERNRVIVNRIKQSVDDGRHVVAVTNRTEHIKTLVRMLKEAGVPGVYGYWRGATEREKFLERTNTGKYRVVIAQRRMVQRGLDVPLWDSYHCLVPTANEYNYYQECSRIRTPLPGKRIPEIVYYMDSGHSPVYAMWHTANSVHIKQEFSVSEDKGNTQPIFTDEEGVMHQPTVVKRRFSKWQKR